MSAVEPIVAIVGRPNVGKSTLFNRIARKRKSIIHSQAGITRDRIYETVNWTGSQFILIDTGGFVPDSKDSMDTAIRKQVQLAVDESDLVLFVVDVMESITAVDREIAQLLHQSGKSVLLVVNKSDNENRETDRFEFFELGFAETLPISALNGRRIGDLLDAILAHLPKPAPPEEEIEHHLHLAIVGMPNVGKSSIVNRLLGQEKSIVSDIPGTTRDSIDSRLKYYSELITLIDTAGLRKKRNISSHIEFYSIIRTIRAIDQSDVSVVVIDAEKGFTHQDASICKTVIDRNKGLIIVVNKWDLLAKETNTHLTFKQQIIDQFKALEHYPILFVSALTKKRVTQILEKARAVYHARQLRVPTNRLNEYFQKIIDHTPPSAAYGNFVKIKYVTQVRIAPPVFVFFCSEPRAIKEEYRRFLENRLREKFGFEGVPLTIQFRQK